MCFPGKKLAGPLSGIATSTPGIVAMTKSKRFRESAFPFLQDPASLALLGGPPIAAATLGPSGYMQRLRQLFGSSTPDLSDLASYGDEADLFA